MKKTQLLIDPSFYNAEERSGFPVSQERKQVWAVELDLLAVFDDFCRENNLRYCVGAGTMLGAVRHHGFIPWDDDIDLYMLRPDFDKLISLSDKFQPPYFLQTTYNEKNLIRTFVRLRNTETFGTSTKENDLDVCKGLFIDIFPLDGISENKRTDRRQYYLNRWHKTICGCYNHSKTKKKPESSGEWFRLMGYRMIARLFVRDKIKIFTAMENNLKRFSKDDTKLWGNRTIVFKCPKSRRPKEDYINYITMPFEMLQVPVPCNYDAMLKQQYGDYMSIPKDKTGSIHGELITKRQNNTGG